MPTPYERIAQARSQLVEAGIAAEDAALDAEVLARHALGWDRATLISHGREAAPAGFVERFDSLVARRVRREPVAQITGHREFWGLDFEITPDVLVPRPETELIVEEALAFAAANPCQTIIDVGTGSGCIAIAVARELSDVAVLATDRSPAALRVAKRNALRLRVAGQIAFLQADLFEGIHGQADLILSNPPYVPDSNADGMQPEVLRFEPPAALFGGRDGLDVVRRVLREAPPRLAPDGRLVVEFGLGQEHEVHLAATAADWKIVHVRADLQGIPRTIVLTR
jgi:release factor glutamine methyltransferase